MSRKPLYEVFERLYAGFGPQHWWPARTEYEVMVGAVLTQNTAWRNVERAIDNLRAADLLHPEVVLTLPVEDLADYLRPAGYFNVKARRLRHLTAGLLEDGGAAAWRRMPADDLRRRLLGINGVGEETADCILLYVFGHPVFVVDAYTRRVFTRLGLLRGDESYGEIAALFHERLPRDASLFNEYHALIVRLGNRVCRPRPRCPDCPLRSVCPAADGMAEQ